MEYIKDDHTKVLYEILVPTVMKNDKGEIKPIRKRFHKVWDTKVREIAGGLTICSPSKGVWVSNDGELFEERMIPVKIMCTGKNIHEIADFTAKYYRQLAIFFYKVSDEVYIIDYAKK